jgi:hypothetical protein
MDVEERSDRSRIHRETAKISWHELQRFFAQGIALSVTESLDLVEVAYQMSLDNKRLVESWLDSDAVRQVSDAEAADWLAGEQVVWSVVVRPWILVQPITAAHDQA